MVRVFIVMMVCSGWLWPSLSAGQTVSDFDTTDCDALAQRCEGYDGSFQYRKEYDSTKFYIEHCYFQEQSYEYFPFISAAGNGLQDIEHDTLWAAYRDWLRSVLYLNSTKNYYCADLHEYALTFAHKDEHGGFIDYKKSLAIYTFLADSLQCFGHSLVNDLWYDYHKYAWQDTVKDSLKTPFDTTLPSLDSVGGGFMRTFLGSESVAPSPSSPIPEIIVALSAVQNPFTNELKVNYMLNRPNLIRFEVYDGLGRMLCSNGDGYQNIGKHSITVNTSSWASGTYYVRLITYSKEIKTLKVIKE